MLEYILIDSFEMKFFSNFGNEATFDETHLWMFLFPSFAIVFELSLKSKQTSALAYNDILSITDTIQTQTSGKSKPIHILIVLM